MSAIAINVERRGQLSREGDLFDKAAKQQFLFPAMGKGSETTRFGSAFRIKVPMLFDRGRMRLTAVECV